MKPLALYDPHPPRNDYLSRIYFDSIQNYSNDHGYRIPQISSLTDVRDCTVLIHGDYLTPEMILRLKENGNKIVSFDINDSSWLMGSYRGKPECTAIDLIYKVAGIQKKNVCQDYRIDSDFNFSLVDVPFESEANWKIYSQMAESGILRSLPYVPWQHYEPGPLKPFSERSGKIICRGGNHFARFMVFLHLMMHGKADNLCSFVTEPYFSDTMNPDFRYCDSCRAEHKQHGKSRDMMVLDNSQCKSPAPWFGNLDFSNPNLWNNRCPRSFFWLADKFNDRYGAKDVPFVERVLNGSFEDPETFTKALSQATGYTDLKWIYSIYAPPRFWEAANTGTVNFLPARTNDQTYFPHIEEGKHYLTFREDFRDFRPEISEAEFVKIITNCRDIYEAWIKPGKYKIHENLVKKIFEECEGVANG